MQKAKMDHANDRRNEGDGQTLLLHEILHELRAIREQLQVVNQETTTPDSNPQTGAVLAAIHDLAGVALFSTHDLIERARMVENEQLSEAIFAACGALNARRLGNLLAAAEGYDCGGYAIIRVGNDRAGTIWRVRQF